MTEAGVVQFLEKRMDAAREKREALFVKRREVASKGSGGSNTDYYAEFQRLTRMIDDACSEIRIYDEVLSLLKGEKQ